MNASDLADGFCEWVQQDESLDIGSPELRAELARLFECVRTETEARVVEAAARHCEDASVLVDRSDVSQEKRAFGCELLLRVAVDLRALAPADYVAVRREDFEVIAEAAEELEARIRMERAGYDSSRADEIRAALSRAGKE